MKAVRDISQLTPSKQEAFAEAGLVSNDDILYYFPRSYIDRQSQTSIADLYQSIKRRNNIASVNPETDATIVNEYSVVVNIAQANLRMFGRGKSSLSLLLRDGTGKAVINFWYYAPSFAKRYKEGMLLLVSGKPTLDKKGILTFTHPEIEIITEDDEKLLDGGGILPKYKIPKCLSSKKISQKIFRLLVEPIIHEHIAKFNEDLPQHLVDKYDFLDIRSTIYNLHFPNNREDLKRARYRIKYSELYQYYLKIIERKRNYAKAGTGLVINPKSNTARKIYEALPFELTKDQKYVLNEMARDCKSSKPMNRLLQGDVGSGKTIVSVLGLLAAIDEGYQAVIMAPTEILCEQHYIAIKNLLKDTDINVVQLVGGQHSKARILLMNEIATGAANIIIGTHALFQASVEYHNLGFVVIDEQHRFGVKQRAALIKLAKESLIRTTGNKKIKPHILYTTATPIPRSLTMTLTGDLDVSFIRSKPKNRIPIKTQIAFESEKSKIYDGIRKVIQKGQQAFIVCPFIDETENSIENDIKTAVQQHEYLQNEVYPDLKCGLLHGGMFWYEKEEVMQEFASGKYDIMISTTVIEVGIDIPNASVMLIENAERFGLAQLHQLRGRVGRGIHQSYCILMTKDNLREYIMTGKDEDNENQANIIRLKTMEETDDGFKISEIDMKIRGPGDIIGTKQSGLPDFKYADIVNDIDIMMKAKEDAQAEIFKTVS